MRDSRSARRCRRVSAGILLSVTLFCWNAEAVSVREAPSAHADFYVSLSGRDSWSGTLPEPNRDQSDGPFASFERARLEASKLQRRSGRRGPVIVMFRGGTYFLAKRLTFGRNESGSAGVPIVYQNYPNETPVISGGMRVQGWKKISDNRWETGLPSSTLYFEQLYYNAERRLRPRIGGYLGSYLRIAAPVHKSGDPVCTAIGNAPFGEAEQNRPGGAARNVPTGDECFDRFEYSANDSISADWENLRLPYPAGDVELYDFERWTVPKLRIKSIDPSSHVIYLTGTTERKLMVNGFFPGHRFIVENVKSEFKEPVQWFLDRGKSPWTLTYLARPGEDPNRDEVIVPQLPQVMVLDHAQWITFQGLLFEHDNFTVPAAGYSSPRQDIPITGAVSCLNCQNISFEADTIAHTSGGALEFKTTDPAATTSRNTFADGAIYDVGSYGIRVGLMPDTRDTDANVPQSTTIRNSVIEGFGRVFPVGFGILQGQGHDNTYTHNEIYDGYHTAIEICALNCPPGAHDSHGSYNNTISFNHLYNLSQGVMNETACVYLNTSTPKFVPAGNKVLNNKCHDVSDASTLDRDGYAGHGIYLDNFTGSVDVENNLVYRVSATAVTMTAGPFIPDKANTIKNNIFAFSRLRMIGVGQAWDPRGCPKESNLKFNATNNIFYFDRTETSRPPFIIQAGCTYSCGFPFAQFQNWQNNIYWRTDGRFAEDVHAFHIQPNAN